jgi:hypothetical protein
MRTDVTENKSVVIRQKMKSAFAKMVLAARARGTAKEKAQQALAALAEFGFVDGFDRQAEAQMDRTARISDQAALVALALMRLSPACARVAITGLPHTVTVPDAYTAEVFRAAIAKSAKQRASDHLVKIVVAAH